MHFALKFFFVLAIFLLIVAISFVLAPVETTFHATDIRVPPAKGETLLTLANKTETNKLREEEVATFIQLNREWEGKWESQPFLSDLVERGVEGNTEVLRGILKERGMSEIEVRQFIAQVDDALPGYLR